MKEGSSHSLGVLNSQNRAGEIDARLMTVDEDFQLYATSSAAIQAIAGTWGLSDKWLLACVNRVGGVWSVYFLF